jgi:hemolysin III
VTTPLKPKLRGWLHAGMWPILQLAGLALLVVAPTVVGRAGVAIYLVGASVLFGTSAVYHRGTWSERVGGVLRRLDHANIFLFIAGTYTPLSLMLLEGNDRVVLLALIWSVAAAGIVFKMLWMAAPRWLYTLLYLVMGWAAVGWLPQFWTAGGPLVVALIALGGLVYTAGAVVYALKRPDPFPTWFGFHEIFHACTIVAALSHFAAITLAVLG